MLTAEQLQKYWDANPAALEQAIQSNPTAFGLTGLGMMAPATNGMGNDGYQIGAFSPQTGTQQDISTGVPNLGQRTDTLATDPFSILQTGLQENYDRYQGLLSGVQNQSTLQGMLAGEDFAYVPGGRVQGIATGGAYLPEKERIASQSAFNLLQSSGVPLQQNGMYLNTGFQYSDGDYYVPFNPDAPIGSYSVTPQKQGGGGWQDVLGIAATVLNPVLGAALGAATGGPREGGGGFGTLFDVANQISNLGTNRVNQEPWDGPQANEPQDPNLPIGDFEGPGGMFDLTILDILRGGYRPTDPQKPTEETGGSPSADAEEAGGTSSSSTPSAPGAADTPPTAKDEGGVILGEYIGNGRMQTVDGRVVSAPPGNWGVGDVVTEGGVPQEAPTGEADELNPLVILGNIIGDMQGPGTIGTIIDGAEVVGVDGDGEPIFEGEQGTDIFGEGEEGLVLGGIGNQTGIQVNPDGSVFNWNTGTYDVFPGTGTTGTGTGTGDGSGDGDGSKLGAAALAAGIGGDDFKKFMAGIDYVVPVLQALNIPFEDYMAMWIQGNKA